MRSGPLFSPFSYLILIAFGVILLLLVLPLLFLGVIGGALSRLGFGWGEVFLLLAAMLLGSFVTIPVAKVENPPVAVRMEDASSFSPVTTIGVNLGGAVIPVLISVYLLIRLQEFTGDFSLVFSAVIAVIVVSVATHESARPVPGVGIALPFFIPAICALICAIILSYGHPGTAPLIAYIGGTIGTLVGADLLNIRRTATIGAPAISIGGAGTFDAVFLSGIIAAFLA